ncbi:Chemotaxis protein MotB [Candidatus Methylobacter favarea]|uniref:Chemotaxis protein MotB n=1 Tax=Candidatus Methylobacter favarea TaxID=2707345 RepID=A0A8S0WYR9_9GAMM|nr:OmpA family protein [Candidatus Methylobacter favarea]CAA9889723.1 Chemotaxis protein MotB [Candidatus Methylobacter favarea]
MSKDPFSKLQSSLSFGDLLDQPASHPSQNWLLSYLDVFVLIVMLVIVLISLSDFKAEQKQVINKRQTEKIPAKIQYNPVPAVCKPARKVNAPENKVEVKKTIPGYQTEAQQGNAPGPAAKEISDIKPVTESETENPPVANSLPELPAVKQLEQQSQPITPVPKPVDENELQQQLLKKINEFGLKDTVNVKVKQGYAELEIQDKVLFKSSDAALTTEGKVLLQRLSPLLKQALGLILIEGHTDNRPINTSQFPSNWELGSSRATSVLHFLTSQQLESSRLRAITYADTMPVADNSTSEGREKNRRVNIVIKVSN